MSERSDVCQFDRCRLNHRRIVPGIGDQSVLKHLFGDHSWQTLGLSRLRQGECPMITYSMDAPFTLSLVAPLGDAGSVKVEVVLNIRSGSSRS